MEYAGLGRTGLKVSRVCLGTNMFGAGYVDDRRAMGVIDRAYDCGINFIDTADAYHDGLSERVVGRAVKGRRHNFVIGTKGFIPTGSGVNDRGLSRKHLVEAVEASLRRLDTDYVDLYQLHYWDPETPLEETLRTLDEMVRQGKIRYLGCSNFAAWQLAKALWASDRLRLERFESAQPEYNFSRREIERELFPLCLDQRVSVVPYQLLMGGVLTGRYRPESEPSADSHMASRHGQRAKDTYWTDESFEKVDALRSMAAETGYEPARLVLAWALSKPAVTSVIVGASRPEQVARNAEAAAVELSADLLGRLDAL